MQFDAIIIGAGAAGLMCAAQGSKNGKKILLIDSANAVGKKIRISGGGRCNFTNLEVSEKNFISNNPNFVISALKRYRPSDFIALVEKHKIAYHEKTLGQLFCNNSSKEIIEMLLNELNENVEIKLETKIVEVKKEDDLFILHDDKNQIFQSKSLVIASGGISIPKMGASDFGYKIAKQFNLNVITPKPALAPLVLEDKLLAKTQKLAGIAINSCVSFNKIKFNEAILFTHFGLSGPAILQISSYIEDGEFITINFAPEIDILQFLEKVRKENPKQEIQNILAQILPRKFVEFILEELNFSGKIAEFSNEKLKIISAFINSWRVKIKTSEGFAKAEVTRGGVDTNEISSKTFESKKVKNLFFIGEVLDVCGHLGGYNFQFAWASGFVCGQYL
jgi:predicted Rossmann fold flavoprotein